MQNTSGRRPERRQDDRIPKAFPIVIRNSIGQIVDPHASGENISSKGVGLETPIKIHPGEVVHVELDLLQHKVRALARVQWVRPHYAINTCGLELKDLGFRDRLAVRSFINGGDGGFWLAFDWLLAASCVVVLGLVLNEAMQEHMQSALRSASMGDSLAPVYFVIAGAAMALVLTMRR